MDGSNQLKYIPKLKNYSVEDRKKIFQDVNWIIDEKIMNNEVVKIILRYNEKRLIKHILDLFK